MLRTALKNLVNVDTRIWLRSAVEETQQRLQIWQQRALALSNPNLAPFRLGYVGRSTQTASALALFRLEANTVNQRITVREIFDERAALVCDMPVPGALRVPRCLRMMVPLDRPLSEISARWKMRTRLKTFAESCSVRAVTDDAEAAAVNQQMLEPFARARHDAAANGLGDRTVQRIARSGHLALLLREGAPIASHLGYSYERNGQRFWYCLRFGYPEEVYSDYHRLSDSNTVNAYWAMRYAIETGHDIFDFGISIAAPDGGLLQFKHRRSGVLSSFHCGVPFWVRLPQQDTDVFLWRWPLFSLEHGNIVLNIGVPDEASEEEILARLRPIAYRGLSAVRVRSRRESNTLLPVLRTIFESPHAASKSGSPAIEVIDARIHPLNV